LERRRTRNKDPAHLKLHKGCQTTLIKRKKEKTHNR
jgi:hypothetical protein